MTRALTFLVYNWPLKLAAIVLATLLYGVFVVTQNTQQRSDLRIPVTETGRPDGVYLLSSLGEITTISYIAEDPTIRVTADSFTAQADLSRVDPASPTNIVGVTVTSIDPRIDVIGFQPASINVRVEALASRSVPVRVQQVQPLLGFDVRDPVVEPETVTVQGPESVVRRVDAAVARIQLDPAGIDFDRDVELIPIDVLGEQLTPVDVEPSNAHVRVVVFTEGQQRNVPVIANVVGVPAPGFELATVAVDPLLIPVEGDADALAALPRLDTEPVSVNGATEGFSRPVDVSFPPGILPAGVDQVTVTVTLRQVTGSRTFNAGIGMRGLRADRAYDLSIDRVNLVIGGSATDLDQFVAERFQAEVDVGALEPGTHEVPIVVDLPAGLSLLSANPPTVIVTVTAPPPSGSAAPSPSAAP